MSRPQITDIMINGIGFARSCVLDQRFASHERGDRTWDNRYADALAAIDAITKAHEKAAKRIKPARKQSTKSRR